MTFKYLFWIEESNIKTYHYRDNDFELVKYKGDNTYKGDIELFWDWWESKSSYVKEFDTIDFCFLNLDKTKYNLYFNSDNYVLEKNTTWNEKQIVNFINLYTNMSRSKLVDSSIENKELDEKNIIINLFPNKNIIKKNEEKYNINKIDKIINKESMIAKYYRNKTIAIKNSISKKV